ncbi:YTH domain-containing protein 1 isoform X2 [Punica granatum]|nr:YTH domain-containing protein 1 isoform X2 [Punica granatum]OWM71948.1 hypothetical protein CDL15_Pgr017831 [Punica granatum]
MSSDSGKDNASVVDSSVTEGKHDIGTFDDPESTSNKRNGDCYPSRSEERRRCHDKMEDSLANKNQKWYSTRYFVIKSLNYQNIQLSIERGIWATQVMNEPILEEAFNNSGKVILIFSVNMSGFFQGYAQMISSIGWRRDNVWSQGNGRSNPWGRSFKVKWLRLSELPFQKTLHLRNPLNDNKPVKISRDCQELPQDIGEALCELLDGNMDVHGDIRRTSVDSPCSSRDEEYGGPPVHMSWSSLPVSYPSVMYQQQPEAGRSNYQNQRSAGILPSENLLVASGSSKVTKPKDSRINRNLPALEVGREMSSRGDVWGLSTDSPLASTLTEDDFLDMSYEEYLEFHGRSSRQLAPAIGSSWTPKESPRNRKQDSELASEQSRSRKRAHHSSQR